MSVLTGYRILDLTRLLPGAIATMFLAEMGAEVIKIEDPHGGDYARWTPPLDADGMSPFFKASNRNKKSVIVDLKQSAGQAIVQHLVTQADAVIEGFRPGVTARLNMDYDTLNAINPRLVYCSLSGWGATGPYTEISGHDLNYVALSGLLGAGRNPQPLGGQVADVGGAYASVIAILGALLQRERTQQGAYIDINLFESSMPFAMYQFVESATGATQAGAGSLTGGLAYYDVYESADHQPMAFAPIEPKFWVNFCNAVAKPEWLPRQHDDQQALRADLTDLFASKTLAQWSILLADADCCWTHITDPARLIDDPHIKARGMAGLDEKGVPFMRSPINFERIALSDAPAYGEHTVAVLQALGYDEAQINAWLAENIIKKHG